MYFKINCKISEHNKMNKKFENHHYTVLLTCNFIIKKLCLIQHYMIASELISVNATILIDEKHNESPQL